MAQTLKEILDAQMQDLMNDILLPKRDTVITTTKPRLRVDEYYPHVIEFKPKAVPGESLSDSFARYGREIEQERRWKKVFSNIDANVEKAKKEIEVLVGKAEPEPKMWFTLTYREANTDQQYVSGVYANTAAEAQEIANTRNIGEKVQSGLFGSAPKKERDWRLPSACLEEWHTKFFSNEKFHNERGSAFDITKLNAEELKEFRTLAEKACHGTIYLSFVALKSGVATIEECLSDGGIAHRVAHLTTGTVDEELTGHGATEYAGVLPLLKSIEARIPGLNP